MLERKHKWAVWQSAAKSGANLGGVTRKDFYKEVTFEVRAE